MFASPSTTSEPAAIHWRRCVRSNAVDTLKLDVCFVAGIATSPVDQAIASAVITAAHGLGAKVVAEGVETADQRAMLAKLKCDAGQDYLFAWPMPAEEFAALLYTNARRRPSPAKQLLEPARMRATAI